ncbi:uncharacterized protein BO66DRAFT_391528 [Aspergillus aculeatinus CBS 121060]|uniref:Uncharacterized protein n=1 Tax=Aspergillus aculeatinus CBS 121060 TaxID=1448322 RepID=A0ACD1HAU5_9EURO|nr:hypothetical protein BO66DRAFT_391528 [Aspergillus aculeatinus CBS 121060]RAH70721.1 hypothetical protein BO66DRAFT_391528 [Aspergillus aculeatinus CBS 121060]
MLLRTISHPPISSSPLKLKARNPDREFRLKEPFSLLVSPNPHPRFQGGRICFPLLELCTTTSNHIMDI